jgi:hypothetical protein
MFVAIIKSDQETEEGMKAQEKSLTTFERNVHRKDSKLAENMQISHNFVVRFAFCSNLNSN